MGYVPKKKKAKQEHSSGNLLSVSLVWKKYSSLIKLCIVKWVKLLVCFRLHVTVQDAEQMRTERTALEKQIRTLQTKCADLEREKYEAVAKVQDCVQLLEEANLQKSQVSHEWRRFLDVRKLSSPAVMKCPFMYICGGIHTYTTKCLSCLLY